MLQPKRTKYRRPHALKYEGKSKAGNNVEFGDYGLVAVEGNYVTDRQIEAARRAISHAMKRQGRMWIRVFPDVPVSKKPPEVRQGKGKGAVEFWICRVKPGRILFECDGVTEALAREAMTLAGAKLPIKTKFVARTADEEV